MINSQQPACLMTWARLGEMLKVLRYGKYGYLPQPQSPPPQCEPVTVTTGSVTASHSDEYFVFLRKGAILNARASASSKLNVAMVHKTVELKKTYAERCEDPCELDIRWLQVRRISETATAGKPPYTASSSLAWDYEVRCL